MRRLFTAILALVIVAAACSGDGSGNESEALPATTTTATAPAAGTEPAPATGTEPAPAPTPPAEEDPDTSGATTTTTVEPATGTEPAPAPAPPAEEDPDTSGGSATTTTTTPAPAAGPAGGEEQAPATETPGEQPTETPSETAAPGETPETPPETGAPETSSEAGAPETPSEPAETPGEAGTPVEGGAGEGTGESAGSSGEQPGSSASTSSGGEATTSGMAGESTEPAQPGTAEPVKIANLAFDSTLTNYTECSALLDHIRTEALSRVGPYGLQDSPAGPIRIAFGEIQDDAVDFLQAEPEASADFSGDAAVNSAAAPTRGEAAPARVEGVDYSGTNVQVGGVDEPDIIKTDGRRIIIASRGVLTVVDVTGEQPAVSGRVLLGERRGGELLLHGDRLLVINNDYGRITPLVADDAADSRYYGDERNLVVIDEVLLDGTPRRGRSLQVEGRYISSRSIDGTARVVIATYPNELGFVYPRNSAGEPVALDANRGIVAQSTLGDWLPDYRVASSEGSVVAEGQLLACERVYVPTRFSGFGTLAVLTFDMNEALSLGDGAATFAGGETIYASTKNLYVSTNAWISPEWFNRFSPEEFDERYLTSIHKFSLTPGGPAVYEASGTVKGHLLNQFSLHEFGDHLFVAVTDGSPWSRGRQSESFIYSIYQNGNALDVVGEVGDMGKGERIYAVRYIGERAYVVTFRQTDPLYVVDLSDPTAPAVLGELKIPGYSAYLHPIGNGRLLGVGRDADDTGRIQGFKLSLFDVSDPANPDELDTWTLSDAQSGVEWNHRAFLWWAPKDLAVLPVYSWRDNVPTGAAVFEVTADGELDHQGFITHSLGGLGFATDCYHEFDSKAVGKNREAVLVLVCKPGQIGNPFGYGCDVLEAGRAEDFGIDVSLLGTAVNDEDRIALCWEREYGDRIQIERSLVIGDNLWTLSEQMLQSNDIDTLKRQDRLPLGG